MIVFDLKCLEGGEVFEGWFRSGAEYDEQKAGGFIQCPFCQSPSVEKAPMAPAVPRKAGSEGAGKSGLAALAAIQQALLKDSEWVGGQFPETARAMHLGELDPRPVHGQATLAEARSLVDEGVPVLPLPLPTLPPGQVN